MLSIDRQHCIVLKDGKFDLDNGSTIDDLREMFKHISEADEKSVVVHFHGGLISKEDGMAAASVLTPLYENAGAYPVLFIWETGWKEVLNQNLPAIFQENLFQRILTRVAQFAKGKLDKAEETGSARAAGDLPLPKEHEIRAEIENSAAGQEPFADVDPRALPEDDALTDDEREQFEEKLRDDTTLEMLAEEISSARTETDGGQASRGATVRASTATLMSPEIIDELSTDQRGARGPISTAMLIGRISLVLARVVQRFANRRDHGFYLTIVEEILRGFYVGNAGRFLWNTIKQDTVESFGVAEDCGGTAFVSELEKFSASGKRPRIVLVGHSAGAIYVCRLLQAIQSRSLAADLHFDVILIAPAADFKLLATTLQSAGNRIDHLRIFGMGDDHERKDAIASLIYPASLLYFVSGTIEDERDCPLVGMARYYSPPYDNKDEFPELAYVRNYALFQKNNAMIWSMAAGGAGLSCDMTSHGGWAATKETTASVVHLLENGYGDAAPQA